MRAALIDGPQAGRKVAGVSLLERMAVACHRGGVREIIILGDGPAPAFRRLPALGIVPVRRPAADLGALQSEGPLVVAGGALFASPDDVRRVLEARGRLVDGEGRPLPLEVRPADTPPGDLPAVTASRPAFVVDGVSALARAERALWDGLETPGDGYLDRWINRPAGRLLSRLLVHTPVSPNLVTIAGTLVGLAGAALIATGGQLLAVLGALVFQASAAIDCVDGELARLLFKESRLGKWLDLLLDNVVHLAIFAAFAAWAMQRPEPAPAVWLAASTAAGALIALALVIRGMRIAEQAHDPGLRALMFRLTNRDFSFFVLLFAALDRPVWFLWPAAIVVHLFWMAILFAQSPRTRRIVGWERLRHLVPEIRRS